MQAIGTLSYPLSFLTIIMAPTTWHFQSCHDSTGLTLWMQVKAMPFFLSSMWMKLWALSTATSISSLLASQLGTSRVICFGPLLIASACQTVLHLRLSHRKREAVLGALINSFSIGRSSPNRDNLVLEIFKAETILSSVVCLLFSASSLIISEILLSQKHLWQAYTCLGLVFLHVVATQVYLHTNWGKKALFPQGLHSTTKKNSLKPSESDGIKWTFLLISLLAATATIIVTTELFRGTLP